MRGNLLVHPYLSVDRVPMHLQCGADDARTFVGRFSGQKNGVAREG
jgi:hypothetical protein